MSPNREEEDQQTPSLKSLHLQYVSTGIDRLPAKNRNEFTWLVQKNQNSDNEEQIWWTSRKTEVKQIGTHGYVTYPDR